MLRFSWSPPDFDNLKAGVERWGEQLEALVHDALEDATLLGEDRMIEILESAITKTGLERAERGGHPGRVETGTMRDAISSGIWPGRNGSREGEWGWLNEVLAYYLFQENGTIDFTAMSALHGSYIEARELFIDRLVSAGLKVE